MPPSSSPAIGIRENLRAFLEQLVQVFFVGLTIGLERTVLPVLAATDFGLTKGSMTSLFAFVVSFGVMKAAMNLVSGQLSERLGRRRLLIWGWIAALPIPVMILMAPSWHWIVAANLLLGINQGFCWSMTVTAKMDIVRRDQRGLATGLNEFAGYGGVALAGLATGYLAASFDPRMTLFLFGLTVTLMGLAMALASFTETLPLARAAAAAHPANPQVVPAATGPRQPDLKGMFAFVTWQNRDFMALSQAGSVEKFVDALMWALVPAWLAGRGASLVEIGWVSTSYGIVWGASQLVTGPMSDRLGRKPLIVGGFLLCSAGVLAFPLLQDMTALVVDAALIGLGMAALYPNLIAAMGDLAHPAWRGAALGVYRFWRDLGYALGALAMGLLADAAGGLAIGFWFTGVAMAGSALWLMLGLRETHPRQTRAA